MRNWFTTVSVVTLLACVCTSASAQTVILALRSEGVDYELESFGRRLDLRLSVLTGIPALETCGRIAPEDVVLGLSLPAGTSLVSESHGGAVYDAAARAVTWNLGTLDPLFFCFGLRIRVTIDIDLSVPDGTMLTATAFVATSTPGDDGSDNEAFATFQAGMLPLDVFVERSSLCHAGDDFATSDTGEPLACAESDIGILPAEASAATNGIGSRLLGQLTTAGSAIAAPTLKVRASSDGGFDCDPSLSGCWDLPINGTAQVAQILEVDNPNPFDVPLQVRRDVYAYALCSDNDALFPGSAIVEDSFLSHPSALFEHTGLSVDCGSSYDNDVPYGVLRLLCDGITNTCDREGIVTTNEPESIDDSFSSPLALVPRFGTRLIYVTLDGNTHGTSRIFDFPGLIVIRSGYGRYNAASRLVVGLAGQEPSFAVGEIRFIAESPVDLLVTDEAGDRVGRGPETAHPDPVDGLDALLGIRSVAEIAGSRYSGPSSEPEEIVIGLPDTGRYRLDVTGTGDGPFRITVESLDPDGFLLSQQVITGDATSGGFLSQAFVLEPDGALSQVSTTPLPCDADGDADVDRNDIARILDARNTPADGDNDPRDRDGDGTITVLDARQCVLECTQPRCATN